MKLWRQAAFAMIFLQLYGGRAQFGQLRLLWPPLWQLEHCCSLFDPPWPSRTAARWAALWSAALRSSFSEYVPWSGPYRAKFVAAAADGKGEADGTAVRE